MDVVCFYFIVMENNAEFVNVAIRIKPVSDYENQNLRVISHKPPVLLLIDRSQSFSFDNIFTEEASQESIYNATVKPLVQYVRQGYNCTVFAYGQTGTGKTYTMGTNSNVSNEKDFGLIPRVLNHFFECTNDDDSETEISVSFIEIYNEKVFDLLQNKPLQVKGLKALGCSKEKVFNTHEARHFLNNGGKNRHIGDTKQNSQSSRSHAIFTIYCNVKHKDVETTAKLNLVDLAGCESVKKTGSYGSTFQEAININRGLLSIGQVMDALFNNAAFIPYRRSIITSLLQDSLNKQNFVSLIACVSPLIEDTTETIQTLEFAKRVGKIQSRPEVNEVVSLYKKENPMLFNLKPNTPFKRPLIMQTPLPSTKKHKPFQPILESNYSTNTTDDQSVASIGSDMTPHILSPIIRKYMNAMESSLMNKMEMVLKSSLNIPCKETTSTHGISEENIVPETPSVNWILIQNQVSKIVRSEIAQLTGNKVRATSSPIGEQINNTRKCLTYDDSNSSDSVDKENEFKVPSLSSKNVSNTNSLVLSPIEKILLRRSERLSMKWMSHNKKKYRNKSLVVVSPRRSVRLSMKRKSRCTTISNVNLKFSVEPSFVINKEVEKLTEHSKEDSDKDVHCNKRQNATLRNKTTTRRKKSTHTEQKVESSRTKNLTVLKTPAGKRLLKNTRNDSPCTAHTKEVLNIINNGKLTELEKLHTIGTKSAEQITLFRTIKGRINKISEIGRAHV